MASLQLRVWHIAVAGLLLVMVGSGLAFYLYQQNQLALKRDELREDYRLTMLEAMESHCLMYGKLPERWEEVAGSHPQWRTPAAIDRLIELEVTNYNSLDECILGVEQQAFDDALPEARPQLSAWRTEYLRLESELTAIGDLEAQLRLYSDPQAESTLALRAATRLEYQKLASAEVLQEYLSAGDALLALRVPRLVLIGPSYEERADLASDPQLNAATDRFEAAIQALLEEVRQASARQ